ncbi:FecCD family ABC transporter permease [Actinokineospora fastidiosa]|nr:iron chelate uptake ABC transporter family permease subunit [Actinokineospora fastidiosa]
MAVQSPPVERAPAARFIGLLAALGVLVVAVGLSVWVGLKDIPFSTVLSALLDGDGSTASVTIRDVRLPRALLGVLVGAALGLAGAVMQALTRNPLADPGLLGVTMGASTAVVLAISVFGISSVLGHVWFGLIGAALASLMVYALGATGRQVTTPDRLVLAGAAVSAVLFTVNSAILLLDPAAFNQFRFWNVGSLAGREVGVLPVVVWFLAPGIVLAVLMGRALNALALGDAAGRGLGANVGRIRLVGVAAIMVLCGAATAAVGPLVFVGLVVPLVARLIVGADQRWVLAYSAVLAPTLLVAADIVGRLVVQPGELQVGIVTAVLGAPVFIALCLRKRVGQW